MKGLAKFGRFGSVLVTSLLMVLAVLVCVPQTAEAAIFGSRSKSVVVQRQQVVRQNVVVQRVVAPHVVRQRVVQQVVAPVYAAPVQQVVAPVYAAPVQQIVVPQSFYAPQALRQQVVGGCSSGGGVLQLNSGVGCQALYGR